MLILRNNWIMGYGEGGIQMSRRRTVVYYADFSRRVDCLLKERVILSLNKLHWRLHEWKKERKKEKLRNKKWKNYAGILGQLIGTVYYRLPRFDVFLSIDLWGGITFPWLSSQLLGQLAKQVFFSLFTITLARNNFLIYILNTI